MKSDRPPLTRKTQIAEANRHIRRIINMLTKAFQKIVFSSPTKARGPFRKWKSRLPLITPILIALAIAFALITPLMMVNTVETHNVSALSKEISYKQQNLDWLHEILIEDTRNTLNAAVNPEAINPENLTLPTTPIYIYMTIDQVNDLDVFNGKAYIHGKINAMWNKNSSFAKSELTNGAIFQISELEKIRTDVLSDLYFPDIAQGDRYTFRQVSRYDQRSRKNKDEIFSYSKYEFGGLISFKPSLRSYPVDIQQIKVRYTFRNLSGFTVKLRDGVDLAILDPQNSKLGTYIIKNVIDNGLTLSFAGSEGFEQILNRSIDTKMELQNEVNNLINKNVLAEIPKQDREARGGSYLHYLTNMIGDNNSRISGGVTIELQQSLILFLFRNLLPIDLVLIGGILNTFVPRKLSDIRLAVPPTLLLSLVFMQQSNVSRLPDVPYVTYVDIVYYLAYVSTLCLIFESVIVCTSSNEKLNAAASRVARILVLLISILGSRIVFPVFFTGN